MEKKFRLSGLQLFAAEENTTKTTDLEPAISVDFTSRLQSNIAELQNLLGITDLDPMTSGSTIKIYKMEQVNTPQHPKLLKVLPASLCRTLYPYLSEGRYRNPF